MQVNIFVSEVTQDGSPTSMLVLPYGLQAVIPVHLREVDWRYLARAEVDDPLIGLGRASVEAALARMAMC